MTRIGQDKLKLQKQINKLFRSCLEHTCCKSYVYTQAQIAKQLLKIDI